MTEGTAAMAGAHAAGEKTERNIVVEGPGRVAVRDELRAPGGTPRATGGPTWCSSAADSRRPCTWRCGWAARRRS